MNSSASLTDTPASEARITERQVVDVLVGQGLPGLLTTSRLGAPAPRLGRVVRAPALGDAPSHHHARSSVAPASPYPASSDHIGLRTARTSAVVILSSCGAQDREHVALE
jgi:hypothetical protein